VYGALVVLPPARAGATEPVRLSGAYPSPAMDPRAAIGMFDSGVGGLTVLHECLVTLPSEDFIYVGDTGRFPYGEHSQQELVAYATELYELLAARAVKLVVVACNSATAAALPRLQQAARLPIIGVVTPEAKAAVQATRNRRIGVLATTATVTSDRYRQAIHDLDAGVEVVSVACPGLAESIQAGEPYTDQTLSLVRTATAQLRTAGVDTVILGCTHYPLVRHMIQRELGRGVVTVAAAEELAREVSETLRRKGWENDPQRRGHYTFCATGDPDEFRRLGTRFLQMPLGSVEHVVATPAAR
jgi:glutamate racemase